MKCETFVKVEPPASLQFADAALPETSAFSIKEEPGSQILEDDIEEETQREKEVEKLPPTYVIFQPSRSFAPTLLGYSPRISSSALLSTFSSSAMTLPTLPIVLPKPATASVKATATTATKATKTTANTSVTVLPSAAERVTFMCKICRLVSPSSAQFESHMKCHQLKNSYKCKICGAEHALRESLLNHIKKAHSMNLKKRVHGQPKSCTMCGVEYTMRYYLVQHMKQIHKMHMCEYCDELCTSESHLQVHQDVCQSNAQVAGNGRLVGGKWINVNDVRCDVCGKVFQKNGSLIRHYQMKHNGPFASSFMSFHKSQAN